MQSLKLKKLLKTRLMLSVRKLKVMMTIRIMMMMKWKQELTNYTTLVYPWLRKSLPRYNKKEMRYINKWGRTKTSKQQKKR